MNTNELIALMEEYKQKGGEMSAILNAAQTMSTTGKTPLGLKRWSKSDKPTMEDFNEDNQIVDAKIRELQSSMEKVYTKSETEKQLSLKASGRWHIYSNFSELGLNGNSSPQEIHDAMEVGSTLCLTLYKGEPYAPYPHGYGVLEVTKTSGSLSRFSFQHNYNDCIWFASIELNRRDNPWSGWKRITTL